MSGGIVLTKLDAEACARSIREYWALRGRYVEVVVERIPDSKEGFQVRSDLVNGMPRGMDGAMIRPLLPMREFAHV